MTDQTLTFSSDELFTIQEMMREAKANPFHPGDYQDKKTEALIDRITNALDESYELPEEKEYEIKEDCAWDREYMRYVPTVYQCGCCHAKVNKNDTMCWHCRSKLKPKNLINGAT